jgi:L-seryl-tRNA(Ser) seleniumtransferase
VGTTNRTHLADYRDALGPDTGLLLQVHTSNYRVEGFTARVELDELVRLGRERGVPVMVDLGSGALLDAPGGIRPEPLVRDVVASGADLVTFSGDKMLGGPQAGIVVGRAEAVETLRRHPLARAVRIDKLLLGALQATLGLYLEGTARETVPVLRMLFAPIEAVGARAETLADRLRERLDGVRIAVEDDVSPVGGGSFPGEGVPTRVVALGEGAVRVVDWERELRAGDPPVVARIREGRLILDPRTIEPTDEDGVPALVRDAWERAKSPAGKG